AGKLISSTWPTRSGDVICEAIIDTAQRRGERWRRATGARIRKWVPPAAIRSTEKLGDGFILHHQNRPPAVSGHTCARGSAHPTYYCRVDSMYRQLDCPRPRKRSCLLQSH